MNYNMAYKDKLPFGETDITAEEYRKRIDYEKAIEVLEELDVENPVDKLNNFIEGVPEMLKWLSKNGKQFPWRYTNDPWKVYIAEILLQRTRGESAAEVYPGFIEKFSHPKAIHEADEEEIRGAVRTLGFMNHRTKTLKDVGRIFTEEFDGKVPKSKEDLKRPWRVGEYVANATQIFSRGKPCYLVDSNVALFFEEKFAINLTTQPHKNPEIIQLADALTPSDPALCRSFYLGIIDLE